jgi:hypothetical protein
MVERVFHEPHILNRAAAVAGDSDRGERRLA